MGRQRLSKLSAQVTTETNCVGGPATELAASKSREAISNANLNAAQSQISALMANLNGIQNRLNELKNELSGQ